MIKIFYIILINFLITDCSGQYNWTLEKDKHGIKVYSSAVPNSAFKAIKVEGSFTGSYSKLIAILTNVSQFNNWIYHSKKKQGAETEFTTGLYISYRNRNALAFDQQGCCDPF